MREGDPLRAGDHLQNAALFSEQYSSSQGSIKMTVGFYISDVHFRKQAKQEKLLLKKVKDEFKIWESERVELSIFPRPYE
jgi:hypothetical protein